MRLETITTYLIYITTTVVSVQSIRVPTILDNQSRSRSSDEKNNNYQALTLHPNPKPYQITYDDGTKSPWIQLKVRGGGPTSTMKVVYEETLDGYVVQPSQYKTRRGHIYNNNNNTKTGKYVYVDVNNSTGDWIDTNLIAGIDNPHEFHVPKHVANRRYSILKRRSTNKEEKGRLKEESQQQQPLGREYPKRNNIQTGNLTNLVVAFRFSNHRNKRLPSIDDLDVLFNNNGPHDVVCPTGSVRDVYRETSYNQLDLQSRVVGWIDIDYTERFCANGESGVDSQFFICLHNALDEVAKLGIDFHEFDKNGDGTGKAIHEIRSITLSPINSFDTSCTNNFSL